MALDALDVFLCHEAERLLRALGQVERVDEAQAVERLVLARPLVVRMLDIEGRYLIRHQYDLVGEQLFTVEARQVALGYTLHQVHDEVSRTRARIENIHIL